MCAHVCLSVHLTPSQDGNIEGHAGVLSMLCHENKRSVGNTLKSGDIWTVR